MSQQSPVPRALLLSIIEGSLYAVMLGGAESYLGALAVELGHNPSSLALLATVPLFLAALAQLSSGWLSRLSSRKRVTVWGVVCQALSLGVIAWLADRGERSLWPLLAAKSAFCISGGIITPTWNAWITALTANVSREQYFARRSAIVQAFVFLAFLAAGYSLKWTGADLHTFATLSLVGLGARLASALALAAQADVVDVPSEQPSWGAVRRCIETVREADWKVATYLALMMFGATISTPFFTPYMLHELKLDYGAFAQLSATSLLSKALVFPFLHRVAQRLGLPLILRISGTGIATVPVLWAMSTRYEWLIGVHLVSGAFWAGLEYSSFQLLMRGARAELRTEFFSLSNAISGLLQVFGSLLGGALLRSEWLTFRQVFVLSGSLRAVPLALLLFQLPRLRLPRRLRQIPTRILTVRPSAGAMARPIVPAVEPDEDTPTPRSRH